MARLTRALDNSEFYVVDDDEVIHDTNGLRNVMRAVLLLALLWAAMLGTDYWQTTHEFEKPVFARSVIGFDDGGSGTYKGIEYSVEIKGNFMPEDEFPGITHTQFSILGRPVKTVIRD